MTIEHGSMLAGEEPTAQWYNEISMYDFNRHTGSGTGKTDQTVDVDLRHQTVDTSQVQT